MANNLYPPITDSHAGSTAFCTTSSAVAWPAIIAGAVVAAATSLGLLTLGSSFGLAIASPWSDGGITTATAVTAGIVIWMIVMQWVSAALGGYLTGRLRKRWNNLHNDEVFFRDTAHGFLTWALATLFTAGFLASAASGIVNTGIQSAATIAAGAMSSDNGESSVKGESFDYYIDGLYRSESDNAVADGRVQQETMGIITHSLMGEDGLSPADKAYLTSRIMRRANVSQAEAAARVETLDNQIESAKKHADEARKTAATVTIFTFLSMLVGAFIASVAAALGGRQRDYI
ncbi:MAG TPA: hypothetical protein VGF14_07650 [Alphaproteobacteria bacterium]